ncbi:hypothetical protein [Corynebacterium sphenisci]|uniref:hypothetical protein n=1 Tax=Corynebacterium sphenisci TaxID=191493 RepID=UPI0026DF4EA8|nr:hypothetical protein [Corynebacterium sphenisci]MDO5731653.1 hypothetical protein [Corynebacterium sphenisci]
MLGFGRNDDRRAPAKAGRGEELTDTLGSDPAALERHAGMSGKLLIKSLDTAMSWQTDMIAGYVRRLRARHPEETPARIQDRIDAQFLALVTGSGGAAGGAAVVPGIGFVTGLGAIAVESLAFLEAAAWHTLASARLRGIDIDAAERRRSLILVSILGSSGTALVAATIGEDGLRNRVARDSTATLLTRMGLPQLGGLNKQLLKMARRRLSKSARFAVLGKLMPMGVGAVVGATANRRLGRTLIDRARASLGPLPADFDADLGVGPDDGSEPEVPVDARAVAADAAEVLGGDRA